MKKYWLIAGVAALVIAACTVPPDGGGGTTTTLPPSPYQVGLGPNDIVFDGSATMYVANQDSATITKLASTDGEVLDTFDAGGALTSPRNLVLDGSSLFVTDGPSGMVFELDTSDGSVVDSWNVGEQVGFSAFDGTKLWVTRPLSDGVTAIEPGVGTADYTLNGDNPNGIVFGEGYVWIANASSDTLERLDPASPGSTLSIPVGNGPRDVVVDPGPVPRILVSSSVDNVVTVVDGATATVVDSWPVSGGTNLRGLLWDEANDRLWIAGFGSNVVVAKDGSTGVDAAQYTTAEDPNIGAPRQFATDGTNVWVVNYATDSVSLFDPVATTPFPPIASIVAAPLNGWAPLEVSFDGSGSSDANGVITDWDWDFDDAGATATGSTTSHVFTQPGDYEVELTVTDDDTNMATEVVQVTVNEPLRMLQSNAVAIGAGELSTCAPTEDYVPPPTFPDEHDGEPVCWGADIERIGGGGMQLQTQVVGGLDHMCSLRSTGTVRCWGSNALHQLGQDDAAFGAPGFTASGLLVEVGGSVTEISAGRNHACAAKANGTVRCWGDDNGRLGDGDAGSWNYPLINVVGIADATAVASGDNHTCVIVGGGSVKCWGDATVGNNHGQLGDGTTTSSTAIVDVVGITTAVDLFAAGDYTCALLVDDTVSCWGDNTHGQFGNGTSGVPSNPSPVASPPLTGLAGFEAGSRHACAMSNNTPLCWGHDDKGQLGDGTIGSPLVQPTPAPVIDLPWPTAMAAGREHTCAVQNGGEVACWGSNEDGQLGLGSLSGAPNSATPVETADGSVLDYGGICGVGGCGFDEEQIPAPFAATETARGQSGVCAIVEQGEVLCGGNSTGDGNTSGSLGDNVVLGVIGATDVATGGAHSCAVVASGGVKCWGENDHGQLGSGVVGAPELLPVDVVGVIGAVEVVTAADSTCARLADGSARCWGAGGERGDGAYVGDSAVPVAVSGVTDAVDIEAGESHYCIATAAGTAQCWGQDGSHQSDGQGGVVGLATEPLPVTIPGVTGVVGVSAGELHSCALLSSGSVKCWGNNIRGSLGNGTSGSGFTADPPVDVLVVTTAQELTSSEGTTCALLADGTVMCWGSSAHGALGNGAVGTYPLGCPCPLDESTPVFVEASGTDSSPLDGVIELGENSGTASGTIAIRTGGALTSWGPYPLHSPIITGSP